VAAWPGANEDEARARKLFAGEEFVATAVTETLAKHISPAELEQQLDRLRRGWVSLRENLRTQLIPFRDLRQRLVAVGAPTEPEQIGLTRDRVRTSFFRAQHIRRRFTVLDLAVRTGTLDTALDGIFGPGAQWDVRATGTRLVSSL
jgi:glycerol-1-phosphate dehydrogenase [NAD(P)+]